MTSPQSTRSFKTYDLDDDSTFRTAFNAIRSDYADNFAVFFNATTALSAVNLDEHELKQWDIEHNARTGTRWIHFWVSQKQQGLAEYLASKYDISPRLLGFLCPLSNRFAPIENIQYQSDAPKEPKVSCDQIDSSSGGYDVEKQAGPLPESEAVSIDTAAILDSISVADIVNDMWHFCTIDWGLRYMYTGINVLSVVPALKDNSSFDKPAGQRLWTSLILCDDGTIISSCERPPPKADSKLNSACISIAKRHVCNVFCHLSNAKTQASSSRGAISNIKIRPATQSNHRADTRTQSFDVSQWSSLLHYYLFDDWLTTYALIARREHPYRHKLDQVRRDMAKRPDVNLLENLHSLGRQLTVLQLMYKSYAQVIVRLLDRHKTPATGSSTTIQDRASDQQLDISSPRPAIDQSISTSHNLLPEPDINTDHDDTLHDPDYSTATNVQITPQALVRFERLLDRIHLYALSELTQCLSEKESLVLMTFNLLTLSESRSVEKLTRTTIVLAKATILFLPVSLLTAYFSIQVGDLQDMYSLRTYWTSFGIVMVVSILFLLLFGMKTDTLKGTSFYRRLHRLLWQRTKGVVDRSKTKSV